MQKISQNIIKDKIISNKKRYYILVKQKVEQ